MGLAVGWSAVVLSFGKKGWRKSLPHSLGARDPRTAQPLRCDKAGTAPPQ